MAWSRLSWKFHTTMETCPTRPETIKTVFYTSNTQCKVTCSDLLTAAADCVGAVSSICRILWALVLVTAWKLLVSLCNFTCRLNIKGWRGKKNIYNSNTEEKEKSRTKLRTWNINKRERANCRIASQSLAKTAISKMVWLRCKALLLSDDDDGTTPTWCSPPAQHLYEKTDNSSFYVSPSRTTHHVISNSGCSQGYLKQPLASRKLVM